MEENGNDEGMLLAAQSGDREAIEQLLRRHRDGIYRHGLRVCRTSEDAEDAVQQTLWAAARSLRSFRRASALSTWLFTIVRRFCFRMLGRDRFYVDLDAFVPALVDGTRSVEDEVVAREVRVILSHALSRLEEPHREVIVLRDLEGKSAPEAAMALGITVAALKSRLHRARDQLREELVRDARLVPERVLQTASGSGHPAESGVACLG